MRTVWTMGFVAAAALSFCFPDFIVFRFTQAVIWAIALLGLVHSSRMHPLREPVGICPYWYTMKGPTMVEIFRPVQVI